MSNIKKGDRVRVEGAVGPYPVADVGAYGPDRFVDVWAGGRKVRIPENWCQPVRRVPLTVVLANLIEDAPDKFIQTAVDVLDVVANRLGDSGYDAAARWLREMADER